MEQGLHDHALFHRKWALISGFLMMFVCCFWGVEPIPVKNRPMFGSTHHQYAHNGELLIAAALVFPLITNVSKRYLTILAINLHLATWTNPIAYMLISISDAKHEILNPHPGKEESLLGKIAFLCVPVICGPTCFIAFGMFIHALYHTPFNYEWNGVKPTTKGTGSSPKKNQ